MASEKRSFSIDDSMTESTRLLIEKQDEGKGRIYKHRRRKATRARKLVVMVAGLVQQFVSVGLGFGLSIMYVELIAVFNAKRSDAALIQGLYLGLSVGTGIVLTGVIKKVGPGPTIIVGAIVAAIGLFTSSFAQNLPTVIALTGVVSGLGMSTCYLSAFISVSWMFHEDPGFPLVCLTIGSSLGQFAIPFLYEYFISEYTWSGAFMLVSGIALQCVPFGVIIYTSREYFVTSDHGSHERKEIPTCEGYMTLLKDFVLWILLFDFLLIALSGNVEAWFIVDIMTSRGYSRESGSILVSALGFANFIGRVSGSTLRFKCTNIPTVYHWLWICPVIALGHTLVINLRGYWAIFAAIILQGAAFGMNNSQTPAIMFEASGLSKYPQAMSLVNLVYGIGNLFSNVIGGFIRDSFGVYDIAYYIAAGASLYITFNSAIVSCIIHRRKRHQVQYSSLE
ncbi:monocarboxylate transporter 3-like [Mercenaria mercenaria]|uniref:monocarboxylate transporter 3-like n=1 Tax=Mercenaria mercenaria TaxID=6596 RepID=UPI00234EFDB0|nr:monocarboxylate transporter 3-like [Mercenaria mercenaria]